MTNRDNPTLTIGRFRTILTACEITLFLVFLIVLVFFRSSRYTIIAFTLIGALSILVTIVDIVLRWRFRRRP
jgi:hypothetical protein